MIKSKVLFWNVGLGFNPRFFINLFNNIIGLVQNWSQLISICSPLVFGVRGSGRVEVFLVPFAWITAAVIVYKVFWLTELPLFWSFGQREQVFVGNFFSLLSLLFLGCQLLHLSLQFRLFSSVTESCLILCDPVDCSTPGLPVRHQLLELTQAHVHQVGDAIKPSHPLSSPSLPALNISQHQGLF